MSHRVRALAVATLCLVGCSRREATPDAGGTAPSASAAGAELPAPRHGTERGAHTHGTDTPLDVSELLPAPTRACRALRVTGAVTAEGGGEITTGAALDRPVWLALGPGATLTVKHAGTAREVSFHGPGRALPCEDGEERHLLVRGRLESAAGQGARPGAEVLVATPFGTVRYAEGGLSIRADDGLTVEVASGTAWVQGAAPPGEERTVAAGGRVSLPGAASPLPVLVGRCETAAADAEARGREVLTPGPQPLGPRAAAHVRARKAARNACAVADAAAGTLPAGPARAAVLATLAGAVRRFRGVPAATPAKAPPEGSPGNDASQPVKVESR